MNFEDFERIFTPEEQKNFLDFLIDRELKEWKAVLADDNALTAENARKIFDYGWQWWNSYNNEKDVEKVDKNGVNCESIEFDLVNWNEVFRLVKEDNGFEYSLHQYASWATIFVYFEKDGIRIDCPFANDNWGDHLWQDLEEGLYTEAFIREIIENPVNATWDTTDDGCIPLMHQ